MKELCICGFFVLADRKIGSGCFISIISFVLTSHTSMILHFPLPYNHVRPLLIRGCLESGNGLTAWLSPWPHVGPTESWSSYSREPTMAMKTSSFGRCMWIKVCMSPSEGMHRVKCWLLAIRHPTRVLLAPTLYPSLTWCQSCRSSSSAYITPGTTQTYRHM